MKQVEHGGDLVKRAKKSGYQINDCADFSANINPLGLSKKVKQVLIESIAQIETYPDVNYELAYEAIAKHEKLSIENIVLMNGAVRAFYDLAYFLKPKQTLLCVPTFLEYEKAFHQSGSEILYYYLQEKQNFTINVNDLLQHCEQLNEKDVFILCNPNNPTSVLLEQSDLLKIVQKLAQKNVYMIIDEAFIDFIPNYEQYSFVKFLNTYKNVIIVKSLTKFYAIAGLRLGYCLSGNTQLMQHVKVHQAPWEINALANAIVPVLFNDKAYQQETLKFITKQRQFLMNALKKFSQLNVYPSYTNYIFLHYLGEGDLKEKLWQYKINIRSCWNYPGLNSDFYRIAVRTQEENRRLINALELIFKEEVE